MASEAEDTARNLHGGVAEHHHDASLPETPTDAQSATASASPRNERILAADTEVHETPSITLDLPHHDVDSGGDAAGLDLQPLHEPLNAVLSNTSSTTGPGSTPDTELEGVRSPDTPSTSRLESGPDTELDVYEASEPEAVPHDTTISPEDTAPRLEEDQPSEQPINTAELNDPEDPAATRSDSESTVSSEPSELSESGGATNFLAAPQRQQRLPPVVPSPHTSSRPAAQLPSPPPMSPGTNRSLGGFSASLPAPPMLSSRPSPRRIDSELILPRWQPDAEVTFCPICRTQFSFFVRKHHCRKCGRVICHSCSPHRIVIPPEFVVRAPGDVGFPYSAYTSEEGHLADFSSITGGTPVRLCNPCVPDPNVTPPHTQHSASPLFDPNFDSRAETSFFGSPHVSSHGRSQSSDSATFNPDQGSEPWLSSFAGSSGEAHARGRSATLSHRAGLNPNTPQYAPSPFASNSSAYATSRLPPIPTRLPVHQHPSHNPSPLSRAHAAPTGFFSFMPSISGPSYTPPRVPHRASGSSSSRDVHRNNNNRPLPAPPRPIPEEDECPICHDELPSRLNNDFEALREAHITECIAIHSTTSRVRSTSGGADSGAHARLPPRPPRRTGMFPYKATEKDCVDDAECTICFEEYQVGVPMARLECLCRFHHACITAWFEDRPGQCPVHQHDSYDRF